MTRAGVVILSATAAAWLAVSPVLAQGVVRHPFPGSDFPIAESVEVPAGAPTLYLSGLGPTVVDPAAERNSIASFGDTRAQTASTLTAIQQALDRRGLSLADVVKMTVFLAGDPAKGGRMDFAGMMEAYRERFGAPGQPNLPARSTVQVAALVNPGWLVEIEVVAVRTSRPTR